MKKSLLFNVNFLVFFLISGFPFFLQAQWTTPVNISPGAVSALLNESMGSCIGASGDTVHVVWADRFNTKKGAIFYTQSADTGLTWTAPVPISDVNGNAWNPAIAVNGSNIHVVWRTIDTVNNARRTSWYRHSTDGGLTWGPVIIVDTVVADWPALAVSGSNVYIANDIVTSSSPYNTEIFFLRSTNNGDTWSQHQQITFSAGRSEDEAIIARGPDVFMSWNDNRNGSLQIFYKHSGDYGVTWDPDTVINTEPSYGTMVCVDGNHVDVPSAGAPSGHYQIHLNQSEDAGVTWGPDQDLTNDPSSTYYYPYMVRDGSNLHMTYVKSGVGGQYLHSGDGGQTWDAPYNMGFSNITPFIAYTACVLHVIMPDSGRINYIRNPTGNAGPHCTSTSGIAPAQNETPGVTVSPNPFITRTTLEISGMDQNQIAELRVFDLTGREILRSDFGKDRNVILDRNNLVSGIYFYRIILDDKILKTGKIVAE